MGLLTNATNSIIFRKSCTPSWSLLAITVTVQLFIVWGFHCNVDSGSWIFWTLPPLHSEWPILYGVETIMFAIWLTLCILYSKTCDHSQKGRKLVFKTNYCLMQVKSIAECSKRSILQNIWPSLSYHLSLRYLFCLFLSGHFTQVSLYYVSHIPNTTF